MSKKVKDFLVDIIPADLIDKVNRSFEIVGDIAITEIDEQLISYEKQIGEAIMKTNSSINTVMKKSGIHKGEFRTQDLIHIAGENKKEAIYKENGIELVLDPSTVYFSSKLGTEREELSSNIKENSKILVMFSGCGPYTFNILKKQPNIKLIDSVEINPEGHKYALKNQEKNKNLLKKSKEFQTIVENLKKENKYVNEKQIISELNEKKIHFYNADVKKIVHEELKDKKYDEIFMPLPKDAQLFLDEAFAVADINCIIHMYDFLHENDFPHLSENAVIEAAKKNNKKVEIIQTRKVGQYSPRKYRVCCDFKILN